MSTPGTASPTAPAVQPTTPGTSAPPPATTATAIRVPREGSYVYEQSGSEKFCQATCSTQGLPPTRTMSLSVVDSRSEAVTIEFAGKVSNMRYTKDTFRFTRTRALLTETYVRFSSGGAQFENSYRPQPPVEALRFPLTTGASWSGSWQADTYGTYSVRVGAREAMTVAGRTIRAFRVTISTTFTGDVDGRQDLTVWIDPSTSGTLRSAGTLSARTFLGRYETTFDAVLRSGPGY